MITPLRLTILALAMPLPLYASLSFLASSQTCSIAPGSRAAVFVFHFVNEGDQDVQISELLSPCGCVTLSASAKNIKPHDAGSIVAVFSVGEREGTVSKTFSVKTNEPRSHIYPLTIVADLPIPVKIEPTRLFWQQGGPPTARTVSATYAPGVHMTFVAADIPQASFAVAHSAPPSGIPGESITFTPRDTRTNFHTIATIKFAGPNGLLVKRSVELYVVTRDASTGGIQSSETDK